MKHPIFHVGECCYIAVPTSSGVQLMDCEVTGPLKRRSIRDLDNKLICYAMAYEVLLDGAVREIPCSERDLRKNWAKQRSDWGMLRGIWQPKREAR